MTSRFGDLPDLYTFECRSSHTKQLAALSIRHAVPTAYQFREFAIAGGLDVGVTLRANAR
jgi:hypothetical protein